MAVLSTHGQAVWSVPNTHFVTTSPSQLSLSKSLPASSAAAVFEWHLRKPFHILATFLATLSSQTPFVLSAVRQPVSSPPNGVQTAWVTLAASVIVAASTMLANFVM